MSRAHRAEELIMGLTAELIHWVGAEEREGMRCALLQIVPEFFQMDGGLGCPISTSSETISPKTRT